MVSLPFDERAVVRSRRGGAGRLLWKLIEPIAIWLPPALFVAPLAFLFVGAFTASWDSRGLRGFSLSGIIEAFDIVRQSIVLSTMLALGTGVIAVAIATPLAYATCGQSGRSLRIARELVALAVVIPSLMLAMGLILAYPSLQGTWLILLVAHVIQAIPFAMWPIVSALTLLDIVTLERASRTLGASPWQRFWLVVVPNIWRAIATGAATAFVISFSESSSSLFLSSAHYRPIGVLLVDSFLNLDQRISAAAACVFTLVLLPFLIIIEIALAGGFRRSDSGKHVEQMGAG